jgi:hypothetical protein
VSDVSPWSVSGSYYEVCNCEAICPCRAQGARPGGRSTYGVCDFALSWRIERGRAAEVDLSGLLVVLAGSFTDGAEPRSPWRVTLYVDDRASTAQQEALAAIFLGRAGGTTFRNFARAFGEVYAVRPARIELDHTPGRRWFRAGSHVSVRAGEPVPSDEPIVCGIPGPEHPGEELLTEHFRVDDPPLNWELTGRTGFASRFSYTSDDR